MRKAGKEMPQNNWLLLLTGYLLLINIIAAIITAMDKSKAQRGRWRIKESTLLLLSALGGSIGMYLTMRIIHHKTRKLKFMLGIPVIFFLEAAAAAGVLYLSQNGWHV